MLIAQRAQLARFDERVVVLAALEVESHLSNPLLRVRSARRVASQMFRTRSAVCMFRLLERVKPVAQTVHSADRDIVHSLAAISAQLHALLKLPSVWSCAEPLNDLALVRLHAGQVGLLCCLVVAIAQLGYHLRARNGRAGVNGILDACLANTLARPTNVVIPLIVAHELPLERLIHIPGQLNFKPGQESLV